MPPRNLVRKVVITPVRFDRSAEGNTALHTRIRGFGTRRLLANRKRVHRLEIPIAQVAKNVTVKVIRPRPRDDVHDPAGGAAVFRSVTVGDDLEFLHRLLRDGRAHAID